MALGMEYQQTVRRGPVIPLPAVQQPLPRRCRIRLRRSQGALDAGQVKLQYSGSGCSAGMLFAAVYAGYC